MPKLARYETPTLLPIGRARLKKRVPQWVNLQLLRLPAMREEALQGRIAAHRRRRRLDGFTRATQKLAAAIIRRWKLMQGIPLRRWGVA